MGEPPLPAPSKVVERPSPLTGLARGGIALAAGVVFLGRELLESQEDASGQLIFIGLMLLGVAAIAGISGIFTWRTTTFIADDDEFRVERNFVSQSSSRVDYTKVQSVDISQPLVARLLGLAKVHIDVGGAGGVDLAFLTRTRAEALREHLLARMQGARGIPVAVDADDALGSSPVVEEPEELIVAVPPQHLLLGTLISLGTLGAVLAVVMLGAVAIVSQTPVTMLAVLIGTAGWVWNQTGRNWGFRMTRQGGSLRLTRGALSTTAQGLRPGRIQAVAIKQDVLQRLTGLYQMTVTVLGYGDPTGDENSATNAVVLPYGTWPEVLAVLRAIWPEVDLSQVQPHPQSERARWLTPFSHRTHTWGIGEHVVVVQHGLLEQTRSIVPHRRMQSASLHQGPIQRRLGLASIHVHTTTGPVSLQLYHLDEELARRVFEDQLSRARLARATSES